jgi:excisionase family DNA binding protein
MQQHTTTAILRVQQAWLAAPEPVQQALLTAVLAVRAALRDLADAALGDVVTAIGPALGVADGPALRALLPALAPADWWTRVLPALAAWLQTEPYGRALVGLDPQNRARVLPVLLRVLQRLADLHAGRPVPLTTATAAAYLGVSVAKVRAWLADGTLPVLDTVRGAYGRSSVQYLIDCREVMAARTRLAPAIHTFQQHQQRGQRAVATAVGQVQTAHQQVLAALRQLDPTVAPVLAAAYYCWHLNHLAKARTRAGAARQRCYRMKDRVLAAIVGLADATRGAADEDGWALPLAAGQPDAAVSLAWHPTAQQRYLSLVVRAGTFRFPFHAREEQAREWLPEALGDLLPARTLARDRAFTFGGRATTWLEERAVPEAEVVAALTAWWCAVTGQPTDAFTADW